MYRLRSHASACRQHPPVGLFWHSLVHDPLFANGACVFYADMSTLQFIKRVAVFEANIHLRTQQTEQNTARQKSTQKPTIPRRSVESLGGMCLSKHANVVRSEASMADGINGGGGAGGGSTSLPPIAKYDRVRVAGLAGYHRQQPLPFEVNVADGEPPSTLRTSEGWVRFVDSVNDVIGVELDFPTGDCNGSLAGSSQGGSPTQHFHCRPNHGIYVGASRLEILVNECVECQRERAYPPHVLASIFVTVLDGDGDGPPRKKQALMSKFFSKQPVPVPATLACVTVSY